MGKKYQMSDVRLRSSLGEVIFARNFNPQRRFQFQCSAPMSQQHPLI
jgi:hypothetical protein